MSETSFYEAVIEWADGALETSGPLSEERAWAWYREAVKRGVLTGRAVLRLKLRPSAQRALL